MRFITALLYLFFCTSVHAQAPADNPPPEKFKLQYNGFKDAAIETTLSPAFYIPFVLGAIAFADSAGARVSKSARRHAPFWGDERQASEAADNLRTATSVTMIASSLLFVDSGWKYVFSNLAFDGVAAFSAIQVRGLVRDSNRRPRPNGSSASFPSGHATAAGSRVALSNYNIFRSDLPVAAQYTLAGINWTLAYLVGYSRIESHNHYPEDVLAGIALGYWVSVVMKKTFTNTYLPKDTQITLENVDGGPMLTVGYGF